jgi:uncharacterized OsmC-like protein
MSEQYLVNTVRSYSSGTVGRSMNTIRNHHLIIDSPTIGEEITSGDAFLAGVSSCGVTLVERAARDMGIPLQRMEVTIDGLRDRQAPSTFARVEMRFLLVGVSQEQAETLVGRYKDG